MTLEKKGKNGDLKTIREISELANIFYVRQKEPLGLGHAIGCAAKFVGDEPFAVMLGDDIIYSADPCIKQLMTVYEERGGTVLGVQPVAKNALSKYGIVDARTAPAGRVKLVEKPAETRPATCVPGRCIIAGRF